MIEVRTHFFDLLLEVSLALLQLDQLRVQVLHRALALGQSRLQLQLRVLQLFDLCNAVFLILKQQKKIMFESIKNLLLNGMNIYSQKRFS
jgi:hypothetical protein